MLRLYGSLCVHGGLFCVDMCVSPEGSIIQYWASLVVQMVENLPTMKETLVHSLGWENALEKNILWYSCLETPPPFFFSDTH